MSQDSQLSQELPLLEIAHVLFMDIVGYSQFPAEKERHLVGQLQKAVNGTNEFRRARNNDQLIALPSGDGIALVFFGDPEAPVRCAFELSSSLRDQPEIKLRMGVHTGPVYRVEDINAARNVAGGGINIAQRVMDCGDAGHILASRAVAEVLAQLGNWADTLHDLGEVAVKHGHKIHLFNLYTAELGNSEEPTKLRLPEPLGVKRDELKRPSSIAVLPFRNTSKDLNNEYLSDGITESIIDMLSSLKLRVLASSTVFRCKGPDVDPVTVGRRLSVDVVVSGRVSQFGNRLVIRSELVDVASGCQLWGEQYSRTLADIFEVQEDIANEISMKLQTRLGGGRHKRIVKRPTQDTDAYKLYLKGRYCWHRRTDEQIRTAISHFREAIRIDPAYALAHAGLADCYATLSWILSESPHEMMTKARDEANKALQIDPGLAEAHASLAMVSSRYGWNFALAEREFQTAIELNPGYAVAHQWYGECLAAMERFDEAIDQLKQALDIDPLSPVINAVLAGVYYFSRRFYLAILQADKTLFLEKNFWVALLFRGMSHEQVSEFPEALDALQGAMRVPHSSLTMLAALGHAYAEAGKQEEARRIQAKLFDLSRRRYVAPIYPAIVALGLRDDQLALAELEKALQERSGWMMFLRIDPRFDRLRSNPRFQNLIQQITALA